MLWDRIKTDKTEKLSELHVIWLDLANAYGSVRHNLLEKAMEFFWIPDEIKNLILRYFKCTYLRFSNNKFSTSWQKLNIGIMMGCVISPLLFVMVMEMLLRSAEDITNKNIDPSMKAFMDDVTRNRIQVLHGTTFGSPTGALQMGSIENQAFKMPQFITNERHLQRCEFRC